jgi:hypothetical protein
VSRDVWLRVGWLALAADVGYWIWQMGHADAESGLPTWHAVFNVVTVIGGCVLFAALLLGTYIVWRVNQRER